MQYHFFPEELEYCFENGGEKLVDKMDKECKFGPLNNQRENVGHGDGSFD